MSTSTSERLDLSEFGEVEPPCDYTRHADWGTGYAVWIVFYRTPLTCGCVARINPGLFCDGCWQARRTGAGLGIVRCPWCNAIALAGANILRVEPLR